MLQNIGYRVDTEIRNWNEFETAFRKTFIFEENKTDLWHRMQSRSQRVNENISTYFHDKVSLCKVCNLRFAEIKEQVAIGLLSEKLRFYTSEISCTLGRFIQGYSQL